MSAVAVNDPAAIAAEIEAVQARLDEIRGDAAARDEIPELHERLRELNAALAGSGAIVRVELPALSPADALAIRVEELRAQIRRTPVEQMGELRLLHDELNTVAADAEREWAQANAAARSGYSAWTSAGRELDRAYFYSGRLTSEIESAVWEKCELADSGVPPIQQADAVSLIDQRIAALRAADRAAEIQRRADAQPKEPGWEMRKAISAAEARIVELSDDPDRRDELAEAHAELGELRRKESEVRDEAARQTRIAEVEARREAEAQKQVAQNARAQAEADYEKAFSRYLAVALPAFEAEADAVFRAYRKRVEAVQATGGNVSHFAHLPITRLALRALVNAGASFHDVTEFDYAALIRINNEYPPVAAESDPEPKPRASCSVCARGDVEAINDALLGGASLRKAGEAFDIPRSTLAVHRKECLDGAA